MKRSARVVKANTKYSVSEDEEAGPRKKCACTGCPSSTPICFARASERCSGNRWTPRWYHVSMGEHYCNECFENFYRSHKEGYSEYNRWKHQWSSKSRTVASTRAYLCSELLPYWAQCQRPDCGRWRQLTKDVELTPDFIQTFQCGGPDKNTNKKMKQDPCSVPEDERVEWASSVSWLPQLRYTPYLKNCPAGQFLTAYYPDGVGLSPTDEARKSKDKFFPYQQPFPVNATNPLHALAFTPDMMSVPEIEAFPELAANAPYLYLGLRNLALVLWAVNPKEWLTKERCMREVVCRGLARVGCVQTLPHMLSFLTHCQAINTGLVSPPPDILSQVANTQDSVVVIGAGISGLAAARTIQAHGLKVTVLEARDSAGGRLGQWPEMSSGHVLTGTSNNPLALIATQLEMTLHPVKGSCRLMTSDGQSITSRMDKRIEFHYNAILDVVADWRKGRGNDQDVSLDAKFTEFHQEFIRESQQYFNDDEERVIQFHLCNLEFACGCSTSQLSSLHWDHNENLPQFGGDHTILPHGFGPLVDRLANGLDVRFGHQVASIDYSGDGVVNVRTENGDTFAANKVVITLPLGVLKETAATDTNTDSSGGDCGSGGGGITFKPALPADKTAAIRAMGAGKVEMVAVRFSDNFWSKSTSGTATTTHRMFGRVPTSDDQRGVFNIFQGISTLKADSSSSPPSHLLLSYIVGAKVNITMDAQTDEQIVALLVDTLRAMFPNKTIPEPSWSRVTRWTSGAMSRSSYSFLPVGCDGSLYDVMAQEVDDKLYFAGEATNRQFPQTVSGAYMSGVREARKIIQWT